MTGDTVPPAVAQDDNSVSAGLGSDLRVAVVGALMPFLAGMLVLVGYLWFDFFGAVLGIGGAVWWVFWWRGKHGGFFPRDVRTGPFVATLIIAFVAFLIALASM